jgi:hypothetical protein
MPPYGAAFFLPAAPDFDEILKIVFCSMRVRLINNSLAHPAYAVHARRRPYFSVKLLDFVEILQLFLRYVRKKCLFDNYGDNLCTSPKSCIYSSIFIPDGYIYLLAMHGL